MDLSDQSAPISAASRTAIKERSIRGGMTTLVAQAASHCITVVSVATLARILTPEDYGCVAMVSALTAFLNLFRDLGLSGATIQKQDIAHDQVSSLFFINVAFGAAITLATIAAAPFVAWFYGKPHLVSVTIGLSFTSFLSSLGAQHAALLNRAMRFRALALIQLSTLLAGFLAALIVATNQGGYWALVASSVISALWNSIALWSVSGFRPSWPRRDTHVKDLLHFGAGIAGFDVAYYFRENMDKILLGRVWGPQPLGLYEKAFSLLTLPISSLRYPLNKVAFPAMSRLVNDPSLFRAYFIKYCSILASVSMPLVGVMYALSDSIVRLLLGTRWIGSAELFRVLAVAGFIETVGTLRTTVILGSGQGKRLFWWGLFNAGGTVLAVCVGLIWGAKGIAVAYCVSVYALFHPLLAFAVKGTPVKPSDFYRAAFKPCLATAVMLASGLFIVNTLVHMSDAVIVCVALPACAVTYLVTYAALPGGKTALAEFWCYTSVLLNRPHNRMQGTLYCMIGRLLNRLH